MAWKDTVWLRNKMERSKRLIGSNSSIVKGFTGIDITSATYEPPHTIGSFTPKYSGNVTIIADFSQTSTSYGSSVTSRTSFKVNDEYVYNSATRYPYLEHNYVYIPLNVVAGTTYTIIAEAEYYSNSNHHCTCSIGASLSESNLVE